MIDIEWLVVIYVAIAGPIVAIILSGIIYFITEIFGEDAEKNKEDKNEVRQ